MLWPFGVWHATSPVAHCATSAGSGGKFNGNPFGQRIPLAPKHLTHSDHEGTSWCYGRTYWKQDQWRQNGGLSFMSPLPFVFGVHGFLVKRGKLNFRRQQSKFQRTDALSQRGMECKVSPKCKGKAWSLSLGSL